MMGDVALLSVGWSSAADSPKNVSHLCSYTWVQIRGQLTVVGANVCIDTELAAIEATISFS